MRMVFFVFGAITMFSSILVPQPYMLPAIFTGVMLSCIVDVALNAKS